MATSPVYAQINDCDKQGCESLESGPAMIIVREHCAGDSGISFCIPCIDQLSAATFDVGTQYLDIPNQCTITPTKRHQGDTASINTTFGAGIICDPVKYGAMLGKQVVSDSSGGSTLVKFSVRPQQLRYFEVVLIPYEGGVLSDAYAIVLPYALPMSENISESFGISDVRQIQVQFMAQPHNDIEDLAVRIYNWRDSYPELGNCEDLEPMMLAA